jgi:heme/copper-type cytochrome/quinol oxidase subunit 1
VVPFAGLAALLVGGFIAYSNREYVGWFAYAPLSNTTFMANGAALITQGMQLGLAIAVVGLLLLAFWAGHRIGSRTRSKSR